MKTPCTRRVCGRHPCGDMATIRTDGNGRTVVECPGCTRNAMGLCRDCPARIARRHLRCEQCGAKRRRGLQKRYERTHYEERAPRVLARWRRRMADPAFRAHRKAYMREYQADLRSHPAALADRRERNRVASAGYRSRRRSGTKRSTLKVAA